MEGGGKGVGVKGLTGVARKLRKYSTNTEQHLWRHLRDRQIEGFKVRRQQPVGRYVVLRESRKEDGRRAGRRPAWARFRR